MQAALTTVIALLSLSLVSSFLDKDTFEYCFKRKDLRRAAKAYIGFTLVLLVLALIVLPSTAQAESFSDAKGGAQAIYVGSVIIAVTGFLLQAIARDEIMKSRNQKTRPEEDNNKQLSDSANRSVSSSEDSQQQAIDAPKEDGRKPQKEPNSKEGTEDSRKPHA